MFFTYDLGSTQKKTKATIKNKLCLLSFLAFFHFSIVVMGMESAPISALPKSIMHVIFSNVLHSEPPEKLSKTYNVIQSVSKQWRDVMDYDWKTYQKPIHRIMIPHWHQELLVRLQVFYKTPLFGFKIPSDTFSPPFPSLLNFLQNYAGINSSLLHGELDLSMLPPGNDPLPTWKIVRKLHNDQKKTIHSLQDLMSSAQKKTNTRYEKIIMSGVLPNQSQCSFSVKKKRRHDSIHSQSIHIWKPGEEGGILLTKAAQGTPSYVGDFKWTSSKKQKIHGWGIFISSNKMLYEGQWHNNQKSGEGYWEGQGGSYYGHWEDNMRNGFGYEEIGNHLYAGEWLNNRRHGKGTQIYEDGSYYDGQWTNDEKHHGIMIHDNGDQYEGMWHHERYNGLGFFTDHCGDKYYGNWLSGLRRGFGLQEMVSGVQYVGYWKNDLPHGHGTQIFMNGSYYDGQWVNGHFAHGYIRYVAGTEYRGDIRNDKKEGDGILKNLDGSFYAGSWFEDQPHGIGIVKNDLGLFNVVYKNGVCVKIEALKK